MNGHLKQIITLFILITELDSLMNNFFENECVRFLFKSIAHKSDSYLGFIWLIKKYKHILHFLKDGDYRRVAMEISFKLQKENLKDLVWNYFVCRRERWNRKMYLQSYWVKPLSLLYILPTMKLNIFWC